MSYLEKFVGGYLDKLFSCWLMFLIWFYFCFSIYSRQFYCLKEFGISFFWTKFVKFSRICVCFLVGSVFFLTFFFWHFPCSCIVLGFMDRHAHHKGKTLNNTPLLWLSIGYHFCVFVGWLALRLHDWSTFGWRPKLL